MANLNDRDNPTPLSNPGESNVVNPNPVDYQDGYAQGRAVEQHRYEANQQIRDNDNAGRGLLVGLILAGTAAIVGGGLYLLNQSNRTPAPVNSTIVVPRAASPSASPSPEVRERVIERDRIVPVPQAPTEAPKVNITLPQQSPPATQAAPAQPQSQPTTPSSSAQPNSSTNSTNNGSDNSPTGSTTNPTGTSSGQ